MNFCLGFILSRDLTKVLLIKKNRGFKELIGKLNGIGGKIQEGEEKIEAMHRECKEETGLIIDYWSYFCTIDYLDSKIFCYYSITDHIFDYKQIEDEELGIYR